MRNGADARRFRDRSEAGRRLAELLQPYAGSDNALVLALPRGGAPVAFEIALALDVPLDVLVVRKLGVPGREELAMGAIASGGVRVLNDAVIQTLAIPDDAIARAAAVEQAELGRRERLYRGDRGPVDVHGRVVVLVDDGLATGSTMRVAAAALRAESPERLVAAAPVGSPETCEALRDSADDVVCAVMPDELTAVGSWYDDFREVADEEVRDLLDRAAARVPSR